MKKLLRTLALAAALVTLLTTTAPASADVLRSPISVETSGPGGCTGGCGQ
jgi:Spy/CpxP family protein refolding chaperone